MTAGLALLLGGAVLLVSVAEAAGVWPAWTRVSTKIVPIHSVGNPGVKIGLAQVTGPATHVPKVKAVLQLEGDFTRARAKLLIPSNSMTDLRRVQGTAVTGVVDYQLMDFSKKKPAKPAAKAKSKSKSQKQPPRKAASGHKHHHGCKHRR